MKAIERFYLYLDYKGIKPTAFEKKVGLSNGYLGTQLRRKGALGEDIINTIIDNCLDLDVVWLIRGEGEMLKKEIVVKSDSQECEKQIENLRYTIELQKELIELLKKNGLKYHQNPH